MTGYLRRQGEPVNVKRVQRLTRMMGLETIYPKAKLSHGHPERTVDPYLLRDVRITRPNQLWSKDITYIRLLHGFVYLVVILGWFSRWSWGKSVDCYTWQIG